MTDDHFITRLFFCNRSRQIDPARLLTIAPHPDSKQPNTTLSPTTIIILMLAGFALGHIARRGRKWAWRCYQHGIATWAAHQANPGFSQRDILR